jgi:hypothetical protein
MLVMVPISELTYLNVLVYREKLNPYVKYAT